MLDFLKGPKSTSADKSQIKTRKLKADSVHRSMRVMINDGGKYHGELGTVTGVKEGCSCRDGWCEVLLDKNKRREEFRYGYRGDVSDLLEVTSEPGRPEPIFITPATAKKGTRVQIWEGSQFAEQAIYGAGTIAPTSDDDLGWVNVEFDGGYQNSYRIGHPQVDGGTSDLIHA